MKYSFRFDERIRFRDKELQRDFLVTFQRETGLSRRELADFLNVPKSTLNGWINGSKTLPQSIFNKVCSALPKLKGGCAVQVLSPCWGQAKGGRAKIAGERDVRELMRAVRWAKERVRLNRKIGTKAENLIVERMLADNVDLKSALAVCLLTDGSLHKASNASYRISFFTTDETLKDIVFALLLKLGKYVPKLYLDLNGVHAVRVCDFELARELLRLSPSYKKSSSWYQSVGEYLTKEKQPTINFLNDRNSQTKIWCIRFAFSTDGSISLSKRGGVELTLSCAHPKLCLEWKALLEKFGLRGKLHVDSNSWSGIYGLRFYNKKSVENFAKMGGFVPGVKVTRNSKYYRGIEKNELLEKCLSRARNHRARICLSKDGQRDA